jgi:hypothetical protein
MTRAEWFTALAALAFPSDAKRAEKALMPFMPWLDDMPAGAFTRESLHHVITSPRKMAIPSYDEIRKPLAWWWWDQKRTPEQRLGLDEYPRLETTPRRAPTDLERHIAAETVRTLKIEIAEKSHAAPIDETLRPLPRTLSDQHLLIEYQRVASDVRLSAIQRRAAEARVAGLRARLGIAEPTAEELAHAAE